MGIFSKPTIKEVDTGTLTITDLDSVEGIDPSLKNAMISFSVPTTDTSGNRVNNWRGKVRVIILTGSHSGAGYSEGSVKANLKAFVAEVEAWVNDGIQSRRKFTDILDNEYNVFCTNFSWSWVSGLPKINYTLELVEGGDIINNWITDLT